jgi:hypothetical protein
MSDWKARALTASRGTRTGAILRAALDVDPHELPLFGSSATVTSDGYILADYVEANGTVHHDAFVGSVDDLEINAIRLADHLGLTGDDRAALLAVFHGWIGADYRSRR